MCSASRGDLTARARIRDAAIECFGQQGFGVSVRAIAKHAGVSAGLVIHHFGSKEKLREACDDHVIQLIRETKTETLTSHDSQTFLHQIAEVEEYAGILAYLVRALQTGGKLLQVLYERTLTDAEEYLAKGVEEGVIRPSRDPAKRARWLAGAGLGSILLLITLQEREPGEDIDFRRIMREWSEEMILPALETYTEGLLTERTMLDAYLLYISDPPEGES
ncbi:MAG TPA: TetR family transcriptional regulator [Candidatus Nocardiopsis merdipullorum]|nr:TetR family transcriptional regulator [Candidatus Nocardiopsis merdipullorum]